MIEKLAENYEQALQEFQDKETVHQQLESELAHLHAKVIQSNKKLQEEHKYLESLRYKQLYQLMKAQGLGVCSAEIVPYEFTLKHTQLKEVSDLEKLGIFPVGKLRFIYFYDKRWHHGGHYETDTSYELNYILLLCPYHFPKKVPMLNKSPFSHSRSLNTYQTTLPFFQKVIKKGANEFIDKNTGKKIEKGAFCQSPIPEKIFDYFQLSPLPELTQSKLYC